MKFSQRAQSISPFLAMAYGEKANVLAEQGHDVVRLNLGEPDFGAPSDVIIAMQNAVQHGDLPYTSALGLPALRQAISKFYQAKHGVAVSSQRIVVTAGASAALLLISAALVNEGDEVVIGDPSYPCNRRFISSFGGKVTLVPTPAAQRFQLTQADLEKAWTAKTKGVVIASPANPTGTCIDPLEMAKISAFCDEKSGWRIVDEIYLNLQLSAASLINTVLASDNDAIVVNSFSKYFGMTGWRLGWCVVPEDMVPIMEKLAQNLYICPSTPAQHAALACFSDKSLAECERRRITLIQRKNNVIKAIEAMGLRIENYPDGAFYVYVNISATGLSAIEFCDRLIENHYVALTPGNDFGEHSAHHYVRLSFAADDEMLSKGLSRMAHFVDTLLP